MNASIRNILLVVAAVLIVGGGLAMVNLDPVKKVDVTSFITQVQNGQVSEISVEGQEVKVTYQDKTMAVVDKEPGESLSELFKNYNVDSEKTKAIKTTIKTNSGPAYWAAVLLPNIIPLILVFALMWFLFRQAQGQNNKAMSFGQANARELPKGMGKVTFADVAGNKEAKQELSEVVEFLKSPEKFSKLGAKIPKGVLLMGSPGTGKTLLARAVAGEADVPFFHISGSEFVEMFVGVGASRVRDLFAKAKKSAPCIIFIDEIDAVGRQRGTGMGGSHDEREQTLNQILVEMDGFEPNIGAIVIAATNRPDVLDPALLRPGRFDRRVVLDPPDINDREAILKIHGKNKPLADDVNLRRIAERTPGFSGADLYSLMNEGAILAAREGRKTVAQFDLIRSIEKVMLGPERKSHVLTPQEKKITAYHEAGHALVASCLPHADPVHKISIIARGHAGGYTLKLPLDERRLMSRATFLDDIAMSLGGYVAEKETFGDITTGPSNDLQVATQMARAMVTKYGMSNLGPIALVPEGEIRSVSYNKEYSESFGEKIDAEVKRIMDDAWERARVILTDKKALLQDIAEELMRVENIEREEFEKILIKHGVPIKKKQEVL
jgi:cell division protease FtsH